MKAIQTKNWNERNELKKPFFINTQFLISEHTLKIMFYNALWCIKRFFKVEKSKMFEYCLETSQLKLIILVITDVIIGCSHLEIEKTLCGLNYRDILHPERQNTDTFYTKGLQIDIEQCIETNTQTLKKSTLTLRLTLKHWKNRHWHWD